LIGTGKIHKRDKAIEFRPKYSIALLHHQIQIDKEAIPIMTYTIADHHGSTLTREETEWPVFTDRQEYCGQIYLTRAWAVPDGIHEELGLPKHIDLFLTTNGQWAATLEHAEHYLTRTEPPTEFRVKGASLGLFIPGEWAESNGINTYADYRVYQRSPGFWDAEEIKNPLLLAGVFKEF
jgi:hypothetical protein